MEKYGFPKVLIKNNLVIITIQKTWYISVGNPNNVFKHHKTQLELNL